MTQPVAVCLVACTDESGAMTYYGRVPTSVDTSNVRAAVTSLVTGGLVVVDEEMLSHFGGKPPGARVVVVTDNQQAVGRLPDGVSAVESVEDAIKLAMSASMPLYVLGGPKLFKAFWSEASSVRLYVTAWKAIACPSTDLAQIAAPVMPYWETILRAATADDPPRGVPTVDIRKFDHGLQFSAAPIAPTDLDALYRHCQQTTSDGLATNAEVKCQ
ncbi:Dihydrofolate reductase incomplete domain containing protein [Pandoravirus salinus]|uniref:Dihydrofolate reductase incomplete domain containing protein n=1 Tax=Pandoravirus salinus TaxID=1349410 RepID=S4W2K5_9VIRU|nr:Dihydrofolate reductase incomplete domain [Pandoravirus salinus]AGO84747.1 Dihydrofolate reductase incomplete domain containing protein [Pandoravirus salinus]